VRTAWLLAVLALAACGGHDTAPEAEQRAVAGRFAAAVLHGDESRARALLAPDDDGALAFLVRRAAGPWRAQHASLRPGRRGTGHWTFAYAGTRSHDDGSFERERGDLVVFLADARVRFFAFRNVAVRYSTHHDSQLLPSRR
jgi:hypothetical protein